MKNLYRLLIVILFVLKFSSPATAKDRLEWMDVNSGALAGLMGCIEVPKFAGVSSSSHTLNLNSDNWVSTGVRIEGGKLLQMDWLTNGVISTQSKYRVMYRIDPRFSVAQVFIQKFDPSTGKFVSDFHQFKDGQLARYQDTPEMTFLQRIVDYTDYFKFNGRTGIPVQTNDVINITLDKDGVFFSNDSEMDRELGLSGGSELLSVSTKTPTPDNRIFYNNAIEFCNSAIGSGNPNYPSNCETVIDKYWDVGSNWDTYLGKMNNSAINSSAWQNMPICSDSSNSKSNTPVCSYDLGRGMILAISGTEIKSETQKFIHSDFSDKDFFYHHSDRSGFLEFKTPWNISGMYDSADQLMERWGSLSGVSEYDEFYTYMTNLKPSLSMDYLYTGRYLMEIEIGNANGVSTTSDLQDIEVEYYISDSGSPDNGTPGESIEQTYKENSSGDGYLWLRVVNPHPELSGTVQVRVANYSGGSWFSRIVNDKIVTPIRNKFQELSRLIYEKIINDPSFQNIGKLVLTLYISIYGLMFLAGAVQITTMDIVIRVLKVAVVLALLSETSWSFFNENLFNIFAEGTEYLMSNVTGATSTVGNMFGFIDPILEKYLNPTLWALLLIQLLQIHNGMTFFAIMTIYALMIYLKAVLQVIIGYCLALVGLSVMISLAPFFIILILFERTKSMFDSWISTLFSQMLQPVIMLIFFLFVDQILGELVIGTVVRACWDELIPLSIYIDLNHMSIPLSFSFTLPFLSGIPFFIPEITGVGQMSDFFFEKGTFYILATSCFIFLALVKMSAGLMDYVSSISQMLTGTAPSRNNQNPRSINPVNSVMNDMSSAVSPIVGAAKDVGGFAKEKLIDQKISRKAITRNSGDIDYGEAKSRGGGIIPGGGSATEKKLATAGNPVKPQTTQGTKDPASGFNVGSSNQNQSGSTKGGLPIDKSKFEVGGKERNKIKNRNDSKDKAAELLDKAIRKGQLSGAANLGVSEEKVIALEKKAREGASPEINGKAMSEEQVKITEEGFMQGLIEGAKESGLNDEQAKKLAEKILKRMSPDAPRSGVEEKKGKVQDKEKEDKEKEVIEKQAIEKEDKPDDKKDSNSEIPELEKGAEKPGDETENQEAQKESDAKKKEQVDREDKASSPSQGQNRDEESSPKADRQDQIKKSNFEDSEVPGEEKAKLPDEIEEDKKLKTEQEVNLNKTEVEENPSKNEEKKSERKLSKKLTGDDN